MKKKSLLFLLLLVFISGCAYFNTFYNAKQYYKKANNATKKNLTNQPTSAENTNYQAAIDRALTLIVRYPNSKYIDDALLLAGKSYYFRHEYYNAKRKFLELMTNYPASPFVMEAKLWMARTQLALDEFEDAETLIAELVQEDVPKKIQGQAYYYLGKFYEQKRNFKDAVNAFNQALKNGVDDQLANTLYSLGTSLDTLGRYEEALKAFERVPKATHLTELVFEGRFRSAQMNKKLGNIKPALETFLTLLADENYKSHIPDIKLQIADTYYRDGKSGDAIDYYDEITQLHEKSIQAAEAYYRMGLIYEKSLFDYSKALDNFLLVKQTNPKSIYADTAEVYARDIQRLQALIYVIDLGKKGETGEAQLLNNEQLDEDSLTLDLAYDMMDTTTGDTACYKLLLKIGGKIFADSVFLEKNKTLDERDREIQLNGGIEKKYFVDWRAWIESREIPSYSNLEIEFNRLQEKMKLQEKNKIAENKQLSTFKIEELDRNLFLLAELYLFRFNSPDSAFNQYDYLIRNFPDSQYAPRALFNMAHLYDAYYQNPQQTKLIYKTLTEKYKATPYGNEARKALDLDIIPTKTDSVHMLFASAESALFNENSPNHAISIYEQIQSHYQDDLNQPKVMYAMGYIYENYLDSLDRAFAMYDSLLVRYPDSPYAKRILAKINAVKNQNSAAEKGLVPSETGEKVSITAMDSVQANADNPPMEIMTNDSALSAESPERLVQSTMMRDERISQRSQIIEKKPQSKIAIALDMMGRRRQEMRRLQMEHP